MFDSLEKIVCKPNIVIKIYDENNDMFHQISFISHKNKIIAVFSSSTAFVKENTSICDFCIEHMLETDFVHAVYDFNKFDLKDVCIYKNL